MDISNIVLNDVYNNITIVVLLYSISGGRTKNFSYNVKLLLLKAIHFERPVNEKDPLETVKWNGGNKLINKRIVNIKNNKNPFIFTDGLQMPFNFGFFLNFI